MNLSYIINVQKVKFLFASIKFFNSQLSFNIHIIINSGTKEKKSVESNEKLQATLDKYESILQFECQYNLFCC